MKIRWHEGTIQTIVTSTHPPETCESVAAMAIPDPYIIYIYICVYIYIYLYIYLYYSIITRSTKENNVSYIYMHIIYRLQISSQAPVTHTHTHQSKLIFNRRSLYVKFGCKIQRPKSTVQRINQAMEMHHPSFTSSIRNSWQREEHYIYLQHGISWLLVARSGVFRIVPRISDAFFFWVKIKVHDIVAS